MNSNQLNDAIAEICDKDGMPYEAFGGKCIPYIGWFWRTVDFDKDSCWFGVMPPLPDNPGKTYVGFMENNKWNYPEIVIAGDDWVRVKELLVIAVLDPTHDNLKAVDDKIHSFVDGKEWRCECDDAYPEHVKYFEK